MRSKLKYLLSFLVLVVANSLIAQGPNAEMADVMRADGKIYVVVLVLGIIFTGIVAYLILIDRKLNRLEKESKK